MKCFREYYNLYIELNTNIKIEYKNLEFNHAYNYNTGIMCINISDKSEVQIEILDKQNSTYISKIQYTFVLNMENYSKVIAPDSGRWFLKNSSLIDFWKNCREFTSNISDIKLPLFMFLKDNGFVCDAVGIIGKNLETIFKIIEPESNRALNVHTGHITLEMIRGNDDFPLDTKNYREGIYYYHSPENNQEKSWLLVQRDFSQKQIEFFDLKCQYSRKAFEPMWCSWVDWDSKDLNTDMLLQNIQIGVSLGIKNFIIDDGWYGNGLDSDYAIDMNIGDWEPDQQKFPDMRLLVEKAHQLGARPFIWCAPHAVAKKSNAYQKNFNYLLADENGIPVINEPQYYSYCFQCPEAREIMANICAKLITKWGFDGSKYDLFNWVPNVPCKNPNHKHDTSSMIEGLEKTLKLIHEKTQKINPNHIIELKQNYGTIFNMQFGNLIRAGDSPFDIETNYQRTLHIQCYTPSALNDYQTFTINDTAEDIACIIIKMIAAGIPSYGVNFNKLSNVEKKVIQYYNTFYSHNIEVFQNSRIPLNPMHTAMCINEKNMDYIFLLAHVSFCEIKRDSLIFNGTYKSTVLLKNDVVDEYCLISKDCIGNVVEKKMIHNNLVEVNVPIGGTLQISSNTEQLYVK